LLNVCIQEVMGITFSEKSNVSYLLQPIFCEKCDGCPCQDNPVTWKKLHAVARRNGQLVITRTG
jgi:hypothetical protein